MNDSETIMVARERRPVGRTQWAAQFAVASELCKRGHEVAFTMGNSTPIADLMVISPSRQMFTIDVKGLYKKNPWAIRRKPDQPNLYYVLAYVPDDQPNRYFVLSQSDVNRYIDIELQRLARPSDYPMTGILWKQAEAHENLWRILPQ